MSGHFHPPDVQWFHMTKRRAGALGVLVILTGAVSYHFFSSNVVSTSVAEAAAPNPSVSFTNEPNDRSPELYQGSFLYNSSEEMLKALAVEVFPEDKVFAFPEPGLGLGSHLKVYRAQPVLIKDGTVETTVRTWSTTVEAVLKENSIELGEKDVVEPVSATVLRPEAGMAEIRITRVSEKQVSTTQTINYSVQYQDDPTVDRGVSSTVQVGKNGTLKKTYLVHSENGKETSRRLVEQKVTTEAVPQIVKRGTKVVTYGTGTATWYRACGQSRFTAASKTLPKGTKVHVVNPSNGKSVDVVIDDYGPQSPSRIIDLSCDAFASLGSIGAGMLTVRLEKPL